MWDCVLMAMRWFGDNILSIRLFNIALGSWIVGILIINILIAAFFVFVPSFGSLIHFHKGKDGD